MSDYPLVIPEQKNAVLMTNCKFIVVILLLVVNLVWCNFREWLAKKHILRYKQTEDAN